MALSTFDTLPRNSEVVLDERPLSREVSRAIGATVPKVIALDEASRNFRLAMEDSSQFPIQPYINNHDRPGMISRDDMTGMRR